MQIITAPAGLLLLVAGCAVNPPVLAPLLPAGDAAAPVELTETPFFRQERHQCGPAALATVLSASGVPTAPDALVEEVYLPTRRGSLQVEILAASRARERVPYVIPGELSALLAELRAGRPVLVLQNLGFRGWPVWHYAVVIGFRPLSDELILRSGLERRQIVSAARFLATWERAGAWGMVVLPPEESPAEPRHDDYLHAIAGLESAGHAETAQRAYRRALVVWPQSPVAWLGLGNVHFAQGRAEAAEAAYRECLRWAPANPVAHNNLAHVLSERGCHRAALGEIAAGLEAAGDDRGLRYRLQETRADIVSRLASDSSRGRGCDVVPGHGGLPVHQGGSTTAPPTI